MTDVSAFLKQWDFDCAMIESFAKNKVDGDVLIAFAGNGFKDALPRCLNFFDVPNWTMIVQGGGKQTPLFSNIPQLTYGL